MVELGNHQGRPPGGQQQLLELGLDPNSSSLSSSLLDYWINQDIASLNFLDGLCTVSNVSANDANPNIMPSPFSSKDDVSSNFEAFDYEKQFLLSGKDNYHASPNLYLWGYPVGMDSLNLDEVFQVEQSDLVQSPTLAALNGQKEPLLELELGEQDFDMAAVIPEINKELRAEEEQASGGGSLNVLVKQETVNKVQVVKNEPETVPAQSEKENFAKEVDKDDKGSETQVKVTSSLPLAIPGMSVRNRRRTISSTEQSVTSSVSSYDEGFDSQFEETDTELQLDSDSESPTCDEESVEGSPSSPKRSTSRSSSRGTAKPGFRKKRYFWQYNIQSKGPKGPKIPLGSARFSDPHILNDVTDPVFSSECQLEGVKHAGKARKGDGNDLTPNPSKLHSIGVELKSLNKMIRELTAGCDSPGNFKPKSRKEKNKLASRSCRLKKKAHHEANKIKLFGLQQEHMHLMMMTAEIKRIMKEIQCRNLPLSFCRQALQKALDKIVLSPVAGHTVEYVNSILRKVASGQPIPGLEDIQF